MAVSLSTLSSRMTSATAATVAAAIGGGTTANEVTALIQLLSVLGLRNDLSIPPLKLTNNSQLTPG